MTKTARPESFVITGQMVKAINVFAGEEVIKQNEVGAAFFRGREKDGEVGIDVESNYQACGPNFRRFIGYDFGTNEGVIKSMCFRSPESHGSGFESICYRGSGDPCNGISYTDHIIDPQKAAMIVAALSLTPHQYLKRGFEITSVTSLLPFATPNLFQTTSPIRPDSHESSS